MPFNRFTPLHPTLRLQTKCLQAQPFYGTIDLTPEAH
jgi:hypothetical protein